jgi:hypothetical protein
MNIRIEYSGEYPTLCSGYLVVYIDDQKYNFGCCLSPGGDVFFFFGNDGFEEVTEGE